MPDVKNCPILEVTGDNVPCGRCWFYLPDGKTCPRHGDVSAAVELYKKTSKLTLESKRGQIGQAMTHTLRPLETEGLIQKHIAVVRERDNLRIINAVLLAACEHAFAVYGKWDDAFSRKVNGELKAAIVAAEGKD